MIIALSFIGLIAVMALVIAIDTSNSDTIDECSVFHVRISREISDLQKKFLRLIEEINKIDSRVLGIREVYKIYGGNGIFFEDIKALNKKIEKLAEYLKIEYVKENVECYRKKK